MYFCSKFRLDSLNFKSIGQNLFELRCKPIEKHGFEEKRV